MLIKSCMELSIVLNNDKFDSVFSKVLQNNRQIQETAENEYTDSSFYDDGFLVKFRCSQYKKKLKVFVEPFMILKGDESDIQRVIHKTEKFIRSYFDSELQFKNFTLSGVILSADLMVGHNNIDDYIKVLRRIGKIKGFSPVDSDYFDDDAGFFLKGNSNAIRFRIYDLGKMLRKGRGTLRAEVQLCKPKAIYPYSQSANPSVQLSDVLQQTEQIFMDTFSRVIPYGDCYKKGTAVDLIFQSIKDANLRRKMLRLVALIPEKKSLHLAQKEMNCRTMDEVMIAFAKINLSPITISKRHDVKHLKNLYEYF